MQLIGVLDLMAGRAVRARGGIRQQYAPVATIGTTAIDGDPRALARAYVDHFGLSTLYAADLDAIGGGPLQDAVIRDVANIAPLWLDAGVSTVERARRVIGLGATLAIVGLETLLSFDALSTVCASLSGTQVAFSLDLRAGEPVLGVDFVPPAGPLLGRAPALSAADLAARAADAGATTIIVIDLARVGAASGPDLDLLSRIRSAAPGTRLLAGGGIRGAADLARLADAGCDGALVASAFHDGALSVSR
jgi:phosphoribosylformimino-5-aminoimidazole carboxamide ribotide isomerase